MRAELGPLARVQSALEEGAKDRRFDRAPIQPVNCADDVHRVTVQLQHVVIVEESAVEMQYLVRAEISARVHGAE